MRQTFREGAEAPPGHGGGMGDELAVNHDDAAHYVQVNEAGVLEAVLGPRRLREHGA